MDFDLRLIVLVRIQVRDWERVYGYKIAAVEAEARVLCAHIVAAAAGERERRISHIHHVAERVRQIEQSFAIAIAMVELEKRIYHSSVHVVPGMLTYHRIAVAAEAHIVIVEGIRLVQRSSQAAAAVVVADKMGGSGKKAEEVAVGTADTGSTAVEVEVVNCIAEGEVLVGRTVPVVDLHIQM